MRFEGTISMFGEQVPAQDNCIVLPPTALDVSCCLVVDSMSTEDVKVGNREGEVVEISR